MPDAGLPQLHRSDGPHDFRDFGAAISGWRNAVEAHAVHHTKRALSSRRTPKGDAAKVLPGPVHGVVEIRQGIV